LRLVIKKSKIAKTHNFFIKKQSFWLCPFDGKGLYARLLWFENKIFEKRRCKKQTFCQQDKNKFFQQSGYFLL
jgi:hypothetical protein